MRGRLQVFANVVGIFFQGRFWNFFFATGGLQERFWRALGAEVAQEAAKALPEASGVDFGRHFGSQNGACFVFSSFRGMVFFACIWTVF